MLKLCKWFTNPAGEMEAPGTGPVVSQAVPVVAT